jgi:PAS domain S-box-containing protein
MTSETETAPVDPPAAPEGYFDPPAAESDDRFRELELRYRGIIDRLPAVLYVDAVTESHPMIDVSPSVEDLLGIPREEFLREPLAWVDAIHPDDLDGVMAESERATRTREPFRMEYRVVHPDGKTVWVREDAVLILDAAGQPLHWLGLMVDVTALIDAQAELHQAKTKYGALVEQIPAIVYVDVADEEMSTTYVSPQIQAILGYSAQEYIDDPQLWERILHPDDRESAMATYLRGSLRFRVPAPRSRRPYGLVPGQRDRPHRLPRPPGAHPGGHAGHHRSEDRGGTDRVPRLSRQADGAPEPDDVRRAARARARAGTSLRARRGRRHGRPRRFQARERLARP